MASTDDDSDDGPVCGYGDTTTDRPCQMPVSEPGDRCHMHPRDGSGPPEGHGSGDPGHSMGDGDGQPPEGNKNAMTHGLYAAERDPFGLFDWFRTNEPAMAETIRRWFWSYMDDAPFDAYAQDGFDRWNPPVLEAVDPERLDAQQDMAEGADALDTVSVDGAPHQQAADDAPPIDVQSLTGKADRLLTVAIHQAVTKMAGVEQAEQVLTKLTKMTDDNGDPIPDGDGGWVEIEQELPVNQPKARMRARDRQWLKDLGILDDPDSQQADAIGSWGSAAKRVAERTDAEN